MSEAPDLDLLRELEAVTAQRDALCVALRRVLQHRKAIEFSTGEEQSALYVAQALLVELGR